jgi:hypothetical protein
MEIALNDRDVLRVHKDQDEIVVQVNDGTKHLITNHIQNFKVFKKSNKEARIEWANGTLSELHISGETIAML